MSRLVLLQSRGAFVSLVAHIALERPLRATLTTFVSQQLLRLAKTSLAGVAFEDALCSVLGVHLLTQRAVGIVSFMRASMSHERVLLLEAHLAQVAVEGTLLAARALVLPQVGWPSEGFLTSAAAERPLSGWGARVLQQLGGFLESQLARLTLKQLLAGMSIHVAQEVRAMLKAFLAHGALVRAFRAVCALVVHQVRRLAEALVT